MANLDTRVITPHLVIQPCNGIYPTMIKSTSSGWITVSTRVLRVKTPDPMQRSSSYKASETLTTLYTQEELHKCKQFLQLPTYEKSQHQRLLNVLYNEESCSYGGHSALAGMNMDEFKKHIHEEYSVLTVPVVISVLLYGFTAILGALITRLTLNWVLLKNRKNPRRNPVQLEQLISNTENL